MSYIRFGRVQLRIMQIIWEKGRVNAREITDAMNKISPIAHSTVQTLLKKLEQKGALDHDIDYRTFIFYSLVDAEKATRSAFHEFVERFLTVQAPVVELDRAVDNDFPLAGSQLVHIFRDELAPRFQS